MADWSVGDCLPGIYVALLGLLAVGCLRRWYDPVPTRVASSFFLVLLVLLGPQLFAGRVLLPTDNLRGAPPFTERAPTEPHGNILQGDLLLLVAPLAEETRSDLLDGRWPLWNDLAGIGMPLIGDPQSQPFQPLVLLAYPFDPITGAAVTAALRILTALTFMYLLLRRWGCSAGSGLLGAFAYGLGGFLLLWLGWPLANTAALFPLVLYAQTLLLERGARRDETLFTLGLASFLLAGHPETIVMGLGVCALFGADRLRSAQAPRRPALRRWLLAAGLATAMTAPVWLPTAAYLPETQRREALEWGVSPRPAAAAAAEGSVSQIEKSWIPILAPNAFGNSRFAHYWGRKNTNEDASGFVGTVAILLAALAWVGGWWRSRRPGEAMAWAVAAAAMVLSALPEGWQGGLAEVPVLGGLFAHGGRRALLFLAFAIAFGAALSLDRIRRHPPPRSRLAATTLALAGLLAWAYLSYPKPGDPERLEVLRIGWLHWQLRFLVGAALLLALFSRKRLATYALSLLLAAELCLAHGTANPPMPPMKAWPTPPPLERLVTLARPGDRVLGLGESLPPNLATLYGLADLRIYNPMAPASYRRLIAPALENPGATVPRVRDPGSPLWRMLGAEWILTPPATVLPPPFSAVIDHSSGGLYRRRDALPRLLLLEASQGPEGAARPGPLGWAEGPLAGDLRPLEASLTLRGPFLGGSPASGQEGLLIATVFRHGPGNPLRRTGGWRILVDGKLTDAVRAEEPVLAFWLPSGSRRLELHYRPPGFLLGCWLAALGAAVAGLRWASPPRPPPGRLQ